MAGTLDFKWLWGWWNWGEIQKIPHGFQHPPPPPQKKRINGLKINPPSSWAKHYNNNNNSNNKKTNRITRSTHAGTFRLSNHPREYLPNFPTPQNFGIEKFKPKISSDSSRHLKSRVTSPAPPSPSRVLDFDTVLCVSAVFKIRNRNPIFCLYLFKAVGNTYSWINSWRKIFPVLHIF